MECRECGFPFARDDRRGICPKCGADRSAPPPRDSRRRQIAEVDVAHRGETVERALEKLEQAVDRCLREHRPGLRVIHGYGSFGGTSLIKPRVIAALHRYARAHGGRVVGEEHNPGATLLMFH